MNPNEQSEDLTAAAKADALRPFTDIGLADGFVAEFGSQWRYVPETGRWYVWTGDRWLHDELGVVQQSAINFIRRREQETRILSLSQRRAVCAARTVAAITGLAKSAPTIATPQALMDANAWVIGVPGGVIDLLSGALLPANPEHLVSKQTTVFPDDRTPSRWLEFLNEVLLDRQDQIDFLQRFCGYALIGKLFEPGLVFLHGAGGNGKGVVLNVLIGILGEYAVSADFGTFAEQEYGERHSTDIARLAGARLVVTEEGKRDQKLNEALIKKLTGGGKMTARFMGKDNFEFEFIAKIIVASNHKPALSSVGEDMRRRLNMIPFDYTVPEDERDQYLGEKLKDEYPRILHWMIEGAMQWQAGGLAAPESIKAVSRGYIKSQDPVAEFLGECCDIGQGFETIAAVYRAHEAWCERNGEKHISRRKLVDRLEGQSGINFKTGMMGKVIDGLTLRVTQ